MAHEVVMPRFGSTVESAVIVEWKVKEGDTVAEDTVLCEVETDKATFEVRAGKSGTVLRLLHAEGEDVPVLSPLALIGEPGEEISSEAVPQEGPSREEAPEDRAPEPQERSSVPSRGEGREAGRIYASPRARRLAEKEGVDLSGMRGSGPRGRIMERDVRAVIERRGRGVAPEGGDVRPRPAETGVQGRPLSGIRRVIAQRMRESLSQTAQYTITMRAPARALLSFRRRCKESGDPELSSITINDLILYAVSRALLPDYPMLNAHYDGTSLVLHPSVHLGVAVDTERGLVVPVVRDAASLSLLELSKRVKELSRAALRGDLDPDLMKGSTFTVTNLGPLGVETFTPVLNYPEVAILGVGGIVPTPVYRDGDMEEVVHEPRLVLSLTCDHQVVDGAPAARFLKHLCGVIADIDLWLAR
ncbi:dihydrolipoamide acetyltransferase family protein [Spirochaeta thermophila]|uniref:Dihydrolipoamide acetyltransferase component of pyruvate dehydrogenase complex n=1 Tax=Winmispira thermophila (strain ATCC 49972 / DSM 6192 / RI 19.B1) TaxID=665571 RepID=E0RRY6_WINT6|nr:dihydrolipoamide acetyltransferase family protein [Spirochaeta thermophila]ADN01773.1 hypothetical protein STHERM_c08240 [Spirochaeta thermophila DSM 6192]